MVNRKNITLLLSGLAVIVVSAFGKAAVPLYDGVGFPDEPYRYADPAHMPKTKPPGAPSITFLPSDAKTGVSLQSVEVGPQIVVYVSPSSISLSQGVTQATLIVQPIKPTIQPTDGTIAGNVYRISGTARNGTFNIIPPVSNSYNYINLRLPQGYRPYPAMEFRPLNGGAWKQINVTKIGNDIYESTGNNSFGDYALVKLNAAAKKLQPQAKHLSGSTFGTIVFAALVVIMAASILFIRRDQQRKGKKS